MKARTGPGEDAGYFRIGAPGRSRPDTRGVAGLGSGSVSAALFD